MSVTPTASAVEYDVSAIEALPRPDDHRALTLQLVQPGINLAGKYRLVTAPSPAQDYIAIAARS